MLTATPGRGAGGPQHLHPSSSPALCQAGPSEVTCSRPRPCPTWILGDIRGGGRGCSVTTLPVNPHCRQKPGLSLPEAASRPHLHPAASEMLLPSLPSCPGAAVAPLAFTRKLCWPAGHRGISCPRWGPTPQICPPRCRSPDSISSPWRACSFLDIFNASPETQFKCHLLSQIPCILGPAVLCAAGALTLAPVLTGACGKSQAPRSET